MQTETTPKTRHEINAERQREIDNKVASSRLVELDHWLDERRVERELAEMELDS